MRRRPAPLPNIDLGADFQVMDDSTTPPTWKTLATGDATQKSAQQVIATLRLQGVWMRDHLGSRSYITKERA